MINSEHEFISELSDAGFDTSFFDVEVVFENGEGEYIEAIPLNDGSYAPSPFDSLETRTGLTIVRQVNGGQRLVQRFKISFSPQQVIVAIASGVLIFSGDTLVPL